MHWIDLHIDTLGRMRDLAADPLAAGSELHVDVPGIDEGGLRLAVWAAWVEAEYHGPAAVQRAADMLQAGRELISRAGGRLRPVLAPPDVAAALDGPASGVLLGLEGAHVLDGRVDQLRAFQRCGVRALTLTWNHDNPFASGCDAAQAGDGGLTPLGRELLRLAQDLGVLVDLAHASPRTLDQALERLERPFMVSHTACAALYAHRRNLSDAQLARVAAAGGLIGISLCPFFMAAGGRGVSPRTVAEHMLHVLAVVGEEHVALGSDLDGISRLPAGFRGVADLPMIEAELAARGVAPETISGIAWRNAARLMRAALGERGQGESR